MSMLIDEIKTARRLLRDEESRTHEAAIELQNCNRREKKAKAELDVLLDELETGRSPYPLFEPKADGNGEPAAADTTPVRLLEPPLEAKIRGRRKKGASA